MGNHYCGYCENSMRKTKLYLKAVRKKVTAYVCDSCSKRTTVYYTMF